MKKSIFYTIVLLTLFVLTSSFTIYVKAEASEVYSSSATYLRAAQLPFGQKAALFFGLSGLGYAAWHRRRRHNGSGGGCLGVLVVVGLVVLGLFALPVLIVVAVIAGLLWLCGVPFRRSRRIHDHRRRHF